jgi:hypothetical protein
MGLFKSKKGYANIGKKSPADKFLEAFRKVANSNPAKSQALLDGALQSFHEGRPENIQALILNADLDSFYNHTRYILFRMSEKSDDKLADIKLALAKIPEEARENFLSKVLHSAILYKTDLYVTGREPFYSLLLQAGADANAPINGCAGAILAKAVSCHHPISVIKLLHDNGASFKDALTTMYNGDYSADSKDTLKHYQQELEDKPATSEAAPSAAEEALRQMLEQVGELTERVSALTEEVRSLKSPADATTPEKKAAPRLPIMRQ